jgi:hypothetical protein
MKVDELKVKLSNLEKNDIIKLAVEFYKLVPKSKKEDYNIDALINTPDVKIVKPSASNTLINIESIETEINTFIVNAKEQYYLMPNRIVSKQERPKWRFKVKAWYKELINTKNAGSDIAKQTELVTKLYELLCEACYYQYFSGDDSFESVGVSQTDFYRSVLQLIEKSQGKIDIVNKGIGLIVNNALNRYTLYSGLMDELVNILDVPDLKYKALEKTLKMLEENNRTRQTSHKKQQDSYSTEEYSRNEKSNNLAEMGFRLHVSLFEYQEAIQFYKQYAFQKDSEVKLYILIRLLFEIRKKDYIKTELEAAVIEGIQPRKSLLALLKTIQDNKDLPKYIG